jgi:hypothetical protein
MIRQWRPLIPKWRRMSEAPTLDQLMKDLQQRVLGFDQLRVNTMIDLMRLTIKTMEAPQEEVIWAMVAIIVALVRLSRESRGEMLDLTQRMIALRMEMATRVDAAASAQTH